MKVIEGLFYTKNHEWIKVEGDGAYIGITDYAQDALGDIVFVDFPEIGDEIEKDNDFAAVESVKAAEDIYMPASGEVVEINEDLEDEPGLLNEDCYKNWIIAIKLKDKSQLEELMNDEEYQKLLDEEE